MSNVINQTVRM